LVSLVIVLAFFGWAANKGQGQLVADFIERLVFFAAGGASAYDWGDIKRVLPKATRNKTSKS